MEVLNARMAAAFKGEDQWKPNRVYASQHARQAEVKVEHRPERSVSYDAIAMGENSYKRLLDGGVDVCDGVSNQSTAARSGVWANLEDASLPHGYLRQPEMLQESSDGVETSHDVHPDDSYNSDDDEPVSPEAIEATEAPLKWPIIQIVAPPPWLPEGWTAVLRTRESGSKDKYYVDPVSQRRFRSKTEVNYFLQTGKSYRYKRNLALLTKPLKEDPVSLPTSTSFRSAHGDSTRDSIQTVPFVNTSSAHGCEHRGTAVGQGRSSASPDLRLSVLPQADLPRKAYSKPGPKPKVKTFLEDQGRSSLVSGPKRSLVEEKKSLESSQGHGIENRGKLILKLKRRTTELDEGERNGKKPRPFEVVGATPSLQGKSRGSLSDEEDRYQKPERNSRGPVPHSLVPSTHVSRRPMTKAPLPSWQYQPHFSVLNNPQHGGSGNVAVSSNGQGHALDTNSPSSLAITETETVKCPPRRESPAEQLQKLGRKLCQQAVNVLCSDYGGCNTLQEISLGLHTISHELLGGFNTDFTTAFNRGFQVPSPYKQHQPIKRIRGSLLKEGSIVPTQCSLVPHDQ